jgi:tetratricopeptide (TPR) repeat protein
MVETYEELLSEGKIADLLKLKYEAPTLDYKETFDISNKFIEHREYLELVKDLAAFSNTEGGYIIYGVEDGTYIKKGLAPEISINENKLNSYIEQYLNKHIDYIISDYINDEELRFIIILIKPSKFERPTVIRKDGQFQDTKTGRSKTVFSLNNVFVRKGTNSTPDLSYWYEIHSTDGNTDTIKTLPVLHNLPKPNYGEIFVGREYDIKKVLEGLLEEENTYRILIHGIGGLGKTALAQRVSSILLEKGVKGDIPLDYLVWVSAKNEEYSPTSIRKIRQDFSTLSDLVDTVIQVLNLQIPLETNLNEKSEMVKESLREKSGIIFIDNWETIEQDKVISNEILEYLLRIPGRNKIVITSRNRITDQNIKNLSPMPMKDEQGVGFLKRWRENFNDPTLLGLNDAVLKKIANAAGGIPIAMIMSLGQISRGKYVQQVIDELLQYEIDDPLLDFCFSESYRCLSDNEKLILLSLSYFNMPINRYLMNAMTDLTPRELAEGIQTISPYSFMTVELQDDEHELIESYILNSLTRSFLKAELRSVPDIKEILDENYQMILVEEGQHVEITEMRDVIEKLGLSTNRHKLAASFAASATRVWKTTNNFLEAQRKFKKAKVLAPDLGYIYAQWAWVCEQAREYDDARDFYSKAIKCDNSQGDMLKYRYQWGMFELNKGDYKEAKNQFKAILASHPDDSRSWHGLGRVLFLDFQNGEIVSLDTIENAFLRGFISRNHLTSERKHNAINAYYLALIYQELDRYDKVDTYISMGLRYDQTNLQLRKLLKFRRKQSSDNNTIVMEKTLPESQIIEGEITKILRYGAFLESEGHSYFVHISQIADQYIKNINEHLVVGQKVKFRIVKVDVGQDKYPQVTLRV